MSPPGRRARAGAPAEERASRSSSMRARSARGRVDDDRPGEEQERHGGDPVEPELAEALADEQRDARRQEGVHSSSCVRMVSLSTSMSTTYEFGLNVSSTVVQARCASPREVVFAPGSNGRVTNAPRTTRRRASEHTSAKARM